MRARVSVHRAAAQAIKSFRVVTCRLAPLPRHGGRQSASAQQYILLSSISCSAAYPAWQAGAVVGWRLLPAPMVTRPHGYQHPCLGLGRARLYFVPVKFIDLVSFETTLDLPCDLDPTSHEYSGYIHVTIHGLI